MAKERHREFFVRLFCSFVAKQPPCLDATTYFCGMEATVTISQTNVMPEVYKITGYTGQKGKDMDTISSTSDDANILIPYFGEAIEHLSDVVSRYGYISESDEEETDDTSATIILELPTNWKSAVQTVLEKTMQRFVVHYICMQWFNLAKKDEVKYYAESCDAMALAIRKYIMERERPSRS